MTWRTRMVHREHNNYEIANSNNKSWIYLCLLPLIIVGILGNITLPTALSPIPPVPTKDTPMLPKPTLTPVPTQLPDRYQGLRMKDNVSAMLGCWDAYNNYTNYHGAGRKELTSEYRFKVQASYKRFRTCLIKEISRDDQSKNIQNVLSDYLNELDEYMLDYEFTIPK